MFVVANRIMVNSGYEEAFAERFRQRAGQVEQQPGFVRLEVMRPANEGCPWVVMTHWRDKGAFEAWVSSEDFKRAHREQSLPKEAFGAGGGLEMHEVELCAGDA
ncbi:antibiotic biosynthesis monooxygenase family protein [Marinobacterium marinum]|uniref:Antibiotic biosynthesis monooxygenase n=1 Tax=Marinobacterium marinum TaxID=2756129 RepID=A0A7W2ABG9_9GAMM|nr:antibiotic biosynthesis monooxygenase [Marinobacterium marinum]MBA4501434.1 antibiotic biosynthesis monooxygenase [Marinobacterium marinum]